MKQASRTAERLEAGVALVLLGGFISLWFHSDSWLIFLLLRLYLLLFGTLKLVVL